MNLKHFKSWKLLYEDNDICFSKAIHEPTQSKVFFITLFTPDKMSIATKHLASEHLHNYVALIEEDGKLHIILKEQQGHSIKNFIKKSRLDYDDRVQIVYEYLKLIEKYDSFPNAIKIQLVDDEQLLISDDGMAFRELIDYTLTKSYSLTDVFKQVGKTIECILHDADGYHSQFIDNLLLGNHQFSSFEVLKNQFKDVFIFEKPEALESINSEYTIIINDLEAGPPIHLTKTEIERNKKAESLVSLSAIEKPVLIHDELQSELAELLSSRSTTPSSTSEDTNSHPSHIMSWMNKTTEDVESQNEIDEDDDVDADEDFDADEKLNGKFDGDDLVNDSTPDPVNDSLDLEDSFNEANETPNASILENSTEDVDTLLSEDAPLSVNTLFTETLSSDEDALFKSTLQDEIFDDEDALEELNRLRRLEKSKNNTKSFKAIYEEDAHLPESLPKASKPVKTRVWEDDEEDDLLDNDMSQIFDDLEPPRKNRKINVKMFLVAVLVIGSLFLIASGLKGLFQNEPVVAKFEIESLRNEKIACMNQSTGGKNIDRYTWEIYYSNTLVQTFSDENLFPVFQTEGTYKIVLKVKDKDGNWSKPYAVTYDYKASKDTTETTESTENQTP